MDTQKIKMALIAALLASCGQVSSSKNQSATAKKPDKCEHSFKPLLMSDMLSALPKDGDEIYPRLYNAVAKAADCEPALTGPIQNAFKDQKITFGEYRELVTLEGLQAAKDAEAERQFELLNAKERLRQRVGPYTKDELECMKDPHCHMFWGSDDVGGYWK